MQEELHFGPPSHGKEMTKHLEGFPIFYDPIAEYMGGIFSWEC